MAKSPSRPLAKADPASSAAPLHSRRSVVLGVSLMAMLLAAAGVFAALGTLPQLARHFPVERVVFVSAGPERLVEVSNEELERVAEALQTRGANMLQLNLNALKGAVKQIAWVRDATVRRQFPGTVEVAIEEHRVAARWAALSMKRAGAENTEGDGGEGGEEGAEAKRPLVNTFGEVFSAQLSDERAEQLPVLRGPSDTSAEVLTRMVAMGPVLGEISRSAREVTLTERRAWRVLLDNGTALELGRTDSDVRLARFVRAYPQVVVLQNPNGNVDLRYAGGFAIKGTLPAAKAKSTTKVESPTRVGSGRST
jgi:cell division protein FtsQ